jgi:transcription initiation factor TFIID subunit 2
MDLGRIKRKIENKEYTLFSQFEDDFRLMLRNCFSYNGPGTYVYKEGSKLEGLFEKELANIRGKEHDETQNMTIVESPASTPRETALPVPVKVKSISTTVSSAPPPLLVTQPAPIVTSDLSTTPTSSSLVMQPAPIVASDLSTTPTSSRVPLTVKDKAPKMEQQRKKSITPVDSTSMPSPSHPTVSEKQLNRMSEKEKMEAVLLKTMTNRHAFEFLRPVDPIKQGIPHYAQIIKTPMDLGKIKSRFKNNQYPNAQAMDSDMRLMFRNCYTFNPPNTYVYDESKQLEEVYDQEWQIYFGNTARRGSTELKKPKEIKHVVTSPVSPTTAPASSSEKAKPKPTSINPVMNESNKKRCERVLKKLWAHQASQPFYEPVDAVALNIPQYYEVIKRPMDLSVIRKNFDTNQYATIWEFERDIRQIFWNCYSFNDHESWVAKQCQALETFFNQIWSAEFANPNALKGEDKRLAQKVVNKLTFHDAAALFNEPVDLESLPDYGRVIKHPIDLRTIWEKLESGKYTSIKAIDQDVRLVFKNCYDYNGPGTYGNDQGKKLEKYYQNISREMRARITAAASSTSPSTAAAAASATSASPKRSHSSSPAPTKSTSSVTVTEVHPPAKKLKAVHHGKSGIAAPAGIPVMANIPAAATTSMPPIEPMDIDPVVLKPPSTVFSSPTVAKSPKSPVVMKSPSVPMKSPSIPMKSPSVPMKSPSVPMKSPAVPKKLPSTVAKSPVSDTPAKLHPTLLSKMESLIIKMMNRKESFGFLEPVSFDQTSELCLAYN